jgi:histidine triad (HIT) family protein
LILSLQFLYASINGYISRRHIEGEQNYKMTDCIFCDILASRLPASIVHQDGICTALLDIQPINPGHTLVIPNSHTASLAELDEGVGAHVFHIAQRVAAALRRSGLRCEGVNLLLADGEAAGQEVFHVHLHVVPRFSGDGFGFRFPSQYTAKPERQELDGVAEKIRNVM